MLLGIIRFMRGYVSFAVRGRYPERFINICLSRGVRLWNVSRKEEEFSACMYRGDYLRIRRLAKSSGVRLSLISKSGLPDFLFRYRGRAGIVLGACAFIISVFIMSQFIWSIDVTGLGTLSETEVREALRAEGLYIGAFKPSMDYQAISRAVMLKRREIGWIAVNVTGSYASVEIKEEAQPPKVEDKSAPCNVKAKADGLILTVEAHEGETVITEGSGVISGQLLVSGVMTDELGGVRLVHASARVIAETAAEAAFSLPDSITVMKPDGESTERKAFDILGLRAPYCFGSVGSPYSVSRTVCESPRPLGTTLPIGLVTERVSSLQKRDISLDENSAKELLIKQSELYEIFALADRTVTGRSYSLTRGEGGYTLRVTYTCVGDIACSEPIGTDEGTE